MNSQDELPECFLRENQLPTTENLALLEAVKNKDKEKVANALLNGAKPDYFAFDEGLPTSLFLAAHNKDFELVKTLLEHGANVETKRIADANTPLHEAAASGSIEICELLLKAGSNIEAPNAYGNTPLHIACRSSNYSIVKLFVKHSANMNARNHRGSTVLHLASSLCSTHDDSDVQILISKYVLQNDICINAEDVNGYTPLHVAAQRGCLAMTKLLIRNGANPSCQIFSTNDKKRGGRNCVDVAYSAEKDEVAEYLKASTKATM